MALKSTRNPPSKKLRSVRRMTSADVRDSATTASDVNPECDCPAASGVDSATAHDEETPAVSAGETSVGQRATEARDRPSPDEPPMSQTACDVLSSVVRTHAYVSTDLCSAGDREDESQPSVADTRVQQQQPCEESDRTVSRFQLEFLKMLAPPPSAARKKRSGALGHAQKRQRRGNSADADVSGVRRQSAAGSVSGSSQEATTHMRDTDDGDARRMIDGGSSGPEPDAQPPVLMLPGPEPDAQPPVLMLPGPEPDAHPPVLMLPGREPDVQPPVLMLPGPEPDAQPPVLMLPSPEPDVQPPVLMLPGREPDAQPPALMLPGPEPDAQPPVLMLPSPEPDAQPPVLMLPGPEPDAVPPVLMLPGREPDAPPPVLTLPGPEPDAVPPVLTLPGPLTDSSVSRRRPPVLQPSYSASHGRSSSTTMQTVCDADIVVSGERTRLVEMSTSDVQAGVQCGARSNAHMGCVDIASRPACSTVARPANDSAMRTSSDSAPSLPVSAAAAGNTPVDSQSSSRCRVSSLAQFRPAVSVASLLPLSNCCNTSLAARPSPAVHLSSPRPRHRF